MKTNDKTLNYNTIVNESITVNIYSLLKYTLTAGAWRDCDCKAILISVKNT